MRAVVASVVLFVVLAFGAAPAWADDRDEARRAFSAGQLADKSKNWRQAIEHYLRAFELVPHHFAAYNIAIDYEHLGQLREATAWLNRYLELAPDAPDRDQVMRLIVDLKLRPAKLTVRSRPTGANVFIDGQKVGVTPYEKAIRGGGRRVAVELRGVREERDVVLEYGEPEVVELELSGVPAAPSTPVKPKDRAVPVNAPGTAPVSPTANETVLEIRGNPQGANVAIDGQVVGTLPTRVIVAPGPHAVEVAQAGYTPHASTATAAENEVTAVDVDLATAASKPRFHYVVGAGGGTDVRGLGQTYLVELGVRALSFDLTSRFGKALGETSIEVLLRYGYGKGRVVPFFSIGYSYIGSGLSYELGAGLRYDVVQRPTYAASIVAEVAARRYAITRQDPMTMMDVTEEGTAIPILVSFQMMIGKS